MDISKCHGLRDTIPIIDAAVSMREISGLKDLRLQAKIKYGSTEPM